MSQQQREALDAQLRGAPLDLGGELTEQRLIFEQMMAAIPLPMGVTASRERLGGIPVVNVEIDDAAPGATILYLHGVAYAIGSAASSVGLASDLARRAQTALITVDYRLAPENPYPAAVENAVAAYQGLLDSGRPPSAIALGGESAGAGLLVQTLVALKARGLPQPSSALLMSPWVDLTLSGQSITDKAAVDPALTPAGLRRRAADYVAAGDAADGLISPVFADLTALPPLLAQAGSHEILLNDATALAALAARAADVAVTLEVTPDVPHVFQGFAATLETKATQPSRARRTSFAPTSPSASGHDHRPQQLGRRPTPQLY